LPPKRIVSSAARAPIINLEIGRGKKGLSIVRSQSSCIGV
jgi:hypothetical protein